jgi:hypothetical protein
MSEPRVDILGVYRLPVSDELFREQFDILYGPLKMSPTEKREYERQCMEQLSSTVLIEARITNCDERFSVSNFYQPQPGKTKDDCQVAWCETYLTDDALGDAWGRPAPGQNFRVGFFIHYWNSDGMLSTAYGQLRCPPAQEMPERLQKLIPYEPVD